MAAPLSILHSSFEPERLVFGAVEKTKAGGKIVNLSYPGLRRLQMQTPIVSLPFGINKPYLDGGEVQSLSLDLSFRGHDSKPHMANFLAKMRAMDEAVLRAAVQNSKDWFGKQMSEEIVREFFRPLVREGKEPYPPTMKVKVPMYNGIPNANIFSEAKEAVALEYITKGTQAKFLLEATSVWFVARNFGVTWRLKQALVVSRPNNGNECAFLADESDEMPNAPTNENPTTDAELLLD